jgi:hypothetical protein
MNTTVEASGLLATILNARLNDPLLSSLANSDTAL